MLRKISAPTIDPLFLAPGTLPRYLKLWRDDVAAEIRALGYEPGQPIIHTRCPSLEEFFALNALLGRYDQLTETLAAVPAMTERERQAYIDGACASPLGGEDVATLIVKVQKSEQLAEARQEHETKAADRRNKRAKLMIDVMKEHPGISPYAAAAMIFDAGHVICSKESLVQSLNPPKRSKS